MSLSQLAQWWNSASARLGPTPLGKLWSRARFDRDAYASQRLTVQRMQPPQAPQAPRARRRALGLRCVDLGRICFAIYRKGVLATTAKTRTNLTGVGAARSRGNLTPLGCPRRMSTV